MDPTGAENMPIYARSPVGSVIASSITGSVWTTVTAVLVFVTEAFAAASAEARLAQSRSSAAVATVEEMAPVVETAVAFKRNAST
mmetsp:Transcript_1701/g.3729  ORF Transcript_1701/g.3729 Transcript_1701/m.3729 type:complete len:85 (-) Transcript_1701:154-408(-)